MAVDGLAAVIETPINFERLLVAGLFIGEGEETMGEIDVLVADFVDFDFFEIILPVHRLFLLFDLL